MEYALAAELSGSHSSDVRALCEWKIGDECGFASASRDKTIVVWQFNPLTSNYVPLKTLVGHENFVTALIFLDPDMAFKATGRIATNGVIVSGSSDKTIRWWDIESGSCFRTYGGHDNTICSLAMNATGRLVSGSWDCTAKIWESGSCVATLEGHSQTVWSVLCCADGSVVTASADKTIALWDAMGHKKLTMHGHTDCIRSLAWISETDGRFVSCSNDGSILGWSTKSAQPESTIKEAHSSFVYSVSVDPLSGEWISSSEDRSVRVWNGAEVRSAVSDPSSIRVQTLMHPCTVWCACVLSQRPDIISGGSDGVVRVFTRDTARVAAAADLAAFQEKCEEVELSSKMVGQVNVNKLPTAAELLAKAGSKDGDVQMCRNSAGNAEAHQWDAKTQQWVKIGDVVGSGQDGGGGAGGKQELNGQMYDFVWDVDMPNDMGMTKIGYNRGEDPYIVAEKFISLHSLPISMVDEVAAFIIQNGGVNMSEIQSAPTAYQDPFTGGTRYTPSTASGSSAAASFDPFTGGGRYVPAAAGGNSTSQSLTRALPVREFVDFPSGNLQGLRKKLVEFNDVLRTEGKDTAFSETDMNALCVMVDTSTSQEIPISGLPQLEQASLAAIANGLHWPQDKLIPILDLLRLVILHPDAVSYFAEVYPRTHGGVEIVTLLSTCTFSVSSSDAVKMLALRFLCNCFKHEQMKNVVLCYAPELLTLVHDMFSPSSSVGAIRALASFLHNLSIVLLNVTENDLRTSVLTCAMDLFEETVDEDIMHKLVVVIGNTVYADTQRIFAAKVRKAREVAGKIRQLSMASGTSTLKTLATDVVALLSV